MLAGFQANIFHFAEYQIHKERTMSLDTLTVYAGTYPNTSAAKADYELVQALYYDLDAMDTFDAAVIHKTDKGKVKIDTVHEQPTRQGAAAGAAVGLATGLVAALFPAVAIGGGLLAATTGGGAILGALTGHAAGGMSRSDLKDLGEVLDNGEAGLVVIAATDVSARVAENMKSAEKVVHKEVKADQKAVKKEIKELEKGS
jgi:uncharacterized membrane protein